jgi:hypothetical protein
VNKIFERKTPTGNMPNLKSEGRMPKKNGILKAESRRATRVSSNFGLHVAAFEFPCLCALPAS